MRANPDLLLAVTRSSPTLRRVQPEMLGKVQSRGAGWGELFGAFGCYRCCRQFLEHPIDQRLGASTEVVEQPGGVLVRNYSCPVASAVRTEPCVCRALAAFFSEASPLNTPDS